MKSKDLNNSQSMASEQTRSKEFFQNSLFISHICYLLDYKTNAIYPNTTFQMTVEVTSPKGQLFETETNLNESIYGNRTRYCCDQQQLKFVSYPCIKVEKKFEKKKNIQFDSIPNVTHYEYAKMSSHAYHPHEKFLHGWKVFPSNISNRNGLAYTAYYNAERHQYVIAIRGVQLALGYFFNLITYKRLFFTDQIIDTLDSARMSIFHDNSLHIPSNDPIPTVISFTGHSLGAALAESLACIYHAHAVTFDSPGTKHILSNDPTCQKNIDLGYNSKVFIHTYLSPHANLINVARPQFGRVMYLTQFGNDYEPDRYYYISCPATCIFVAAWIFTNIINKKSFQIGLWLTIMYYIQKSATFCSMRYFFNVYSKFFDALNRFIDVFPLIITILFLYQSINTLASLIEQSANRIYDHFFLRSTSYFNALATFIWQNMNFNCVICRALVRIIYVMLSVLINIGTPCCLYYRWFRPAHTIKNFVQSFDSENGKPYEGQYIDSNMWPTFFEYVIKKPSRHFLRVILIIQYMKLVAFHFFPSSHPWFRKNFILLTFCLFFNIRCLEHLYSMFTFLLMVIIHASYSNNQHYRKTLVCVTCGILMIIEVLHETHQMNSLYFEMVSCSLILISYIKRLGLL